MGDRLDREWFLQSLPVCTHTIIGARIVSPSNVK
jgi:hypothetical protein